MNLQDILSIFDFAFVPGKKKTFDGKKYETVKNIFFVTEWLTMDIDGSIDSDFFFISLIVRDGEEQGSLSKLMLKLDNNLMNQSPHAILHIIKCPN